jgi:hypothetical protein
MAMSVSTQTSVRSPQPESRRTIKTMSTIKTNPINSVTAVTTNSALSGFRKSISTADTSVM